MYCLASKFIQIGAGVEGQKALPFAQKATRRPWFSPRLWLEQFFFSSINEHSSRTSRTLSYEFDGRTSIWHILMTKDHF